MSWRNLKKTYSSGQPCKKVSFGTTIFCFFWKVIFRSWWLVRTKAKSIASKNRRKTVISSLQLKKIYILIWPGLQEGFFRHHHLLFFMKGYKQKLVTCTKKCEIDCFQKPAKSCYFFTTNYKNNRYFCRLIALICGRIINKLITFIYVNSCWRSYCWSYSSIFCK